MTSTGSLIAKEGLQKRRSATRYEANPYEDEPSQSRSAPRTGLGPSGSYVGSRLFGPNDPRCIDASGARPDGPVQPTAPRRRTRRNKRRAVRVDRHCVVLDCGRRSGPEDLLGRRVHIRHVLVGRHFRTRRHLTRLCSGRRAGGRGSISVTGIVVFFALIFLLVVGTNWVDDDLTLGTFRTIASDAAQAGALYGAAGGAQDACYQAAARAQTDLVPGRFARTVTITCTLQQLPSGAKVLVAVADGTLPNWVVPVPVHVHIVAQVPVQASPAQPSTVDP